MAILTISGANVLTSTHKHTYTIAPTQSHLHNCPKPSFPPSMPFEIFITPTPTRACVPRIDVTEHTSDAEGKSKREAASYVPEIAFVPSPTPFEIRSGLDEADPKRWSEAGSRLTDNLCPSRTPSRPPSRTPSPSQRVASPTQSQEGQSGKVTDSVNEGDKASASDDL
jgi:hypothetical protein